MGEYKYNSGRGGGYSGKKSGGKDFKADPFKGFLMARSVALSYAKDLCVAGKIDLGQIPDYTDRMTVIQYGQLKTNPLVDAEVIRIAARIMKRVEEKQDGPDTKKKEVLCVSCAFGPVEGSGECDCGEDEVTDCTQYEVPDAPPPQRGHDLDQHAANERTRELQEQEQQAAEDDADRASQDAENRDNAGIAKDMKPGSDTIYNCSSCDRKYKTMSGLEKHVKKEHSS